MTGSYVGKGVRSVKLAPEIRSLQFLESRPGYADPLKGFQRNFGHCGVVLLRWR